MLNEMSPSQKAAVAGFFHSPIRTRRISRKLPGPEMSLIGNQIETESNLVVARGGKEGKQGVLVGMGFLFGMTEMLWI